MMIDRAQRVLRQALLREVGRRAMTARERAKPEKSERTTRDEEAATSTVNEAEARPDAGKGRPNAI
jgi:hypothetical protein